MKRLEQLLSIAFLAGVSPAQHAVCRAGKPIAPTMPPASSLRSSWLFVAWVTTRPIQRILRKR